MSEFLRLVLDSIAYLWPFRVVMEWQRATYYVCGRFWKTMGPGLKFVVPFFTELREEGVVPNVHVTPLQSIMLKDGGTLTFSATVTMEVFDLGKATNSVMKWQEAALEVTAGLLAEKLARTDAGLFEPEERGRLVGGCKTSLSSSLGEFGVKVTALRFNNFVRNMKVFRLLQDHIYPGN